MMKLVLAIALVGSAEAFKASPTINPAIMKHEPSLTSALALRGGGVVDQGIWLKAFTAFMGLYALGFVLAPAMVIEQNFDTTYDKYHLFISRIAGVAFMTLLYTFNTIDIATAIPIAVAYTCFTAVAGPLYAELNLETKPAHKVALLMAPLVISGFLAL